MEIDKYTVNKFSINRLSRYIANKLEHLINCAHEKLNKNKNGGMIQGDLISKAVTELITAKTLGLKTSYLVK
jgi:hypothetical protein